MKTIIRNVAVGLASVFTVMYIVLIFAMIIMGIITEFTRQPIQITPDDLGGPVWSGVILFVPLFYTIIVFGVFPPHQKTTTKPIIIQYTNLLFKYQNPDAQPIKDFLDKHSDNKDLLRRAKVLNKVFGLKNIGIQ